MIATVELAAQFQDRLRAEAISAFPYECCGLVEGAVEGSIARVAALHPMPNLAREPNRFEIDPVLHIALLQKLRGTERAIIGCYHSHPNGRAEPSTRDRESATENAFLWLIVAVDACTGITSTAAFANTGQSFSTVEIVDALPGTAGVPPASPKANSAPRDRLIAPPRRSYNCVSPRTAPIV